MVTGIDEETGLNPAAAQALSQVRFLYHPPISNKNPARSGHRAETLQNHTAIDKELSRQSCRIRQEPATSSAPDFAAFCMNSFTSRRKAMGSFERVAPAIYGR